MNFGETCDDGNEIPGDGCEPDCTSSDDVEPLWVLDLGGPTGYVDCGRGVAFDSNNNLILSAYTQPDVIWIRKYDTSYTELWTTSYASVPGGSCQSVRVAVDGDDNIGFIGEVPTGAPSDTDIFFGMLNSDGTEAWTASMGGDADYSDYAGDTAFDLDGNLLVTGGLTNSGFFPVLWTAKFAADGGTIWSQAQAVEASDLGYGIAADDDNNVVVAGSSRTGLNTNIFVRKYDADGNEQWTDVVDGLASETDWARGVTTSDSDIVIAGIIRNVSMDPDAWLRRYEGDGSTTWSSTYSGTALSNDGAADVVSTDVGLITAGSVNNGSGSRFWLARLTDDGTAVWQRVYDLPGSWNSVAVAPDGRIAVAGDSPQPFPWDYEATFAVYSP